MKRLLLFAICQMIFNCAIVYGQSAKSDSLFAKGVELYDNGKYKESILFFEESNKLDNAELDSTSNRRIYSSMWLASCYYKLNNENLAKSYYEHYKEIPVDRRKTIVSDSLSKLGSQYFAEKKYQEALKCLNKCAEIEGIAAGADSWFLSNTLYYIGIIYSNLNQNDKAVEYFNRVVDIYRSKGYDVNATFSVLLNQLALCYNALQKNEDAVKTIEEAVAVAKKSYGENNYNYALILSNAGLCHRSAKNYTEAISYYRQTATILQKLNDNDITFINTRRKEAECLSLNGQFDEASSIFKEVLPLYKDKFGYKSGKYLYVIEELHTATKKMGKIEEAIKLCNESISLRMELFGNSGTGLAVQYREQAENYVALKQFKDAITCASKSMEIYKEAKGEKDEYYASALAYLGYCYSYDKQYEKAIEIVKQAIDIRRITIGEDNPNFITSVLNLGTYYKEIFQYKKAIECGKFVVAQREKVYGDKSIEFARGLSWLAGFYHKDGKYKEAVELQKQSCQIFYNSKDNDYPIQLGSLASYYSDYGECRKAVETGLNALNIGQSIWGEDNANYVIMLESIGKYYSDFGDNEKAVDLSEKALQKAVELYGHESLESSGILNRMSDYYQQLGKFDKALEFAQKALIIREKQRQTAPIEYAASLGTMSVIYSETGNYIKAKDYSLQQQKILLNVLGDNHPLYIQSLKNYSAYVSKSGDFFQALSIIEFILNKVKENFDATSMNYIEALSSAAYVYGSMNMLKEAIALEKEVSAYCKEYVPSSNPFYLRNQRNLAQDLMTLGNYTEAREILMDIDSSILEKLGENHPLYYHHLTTMSKFYQEVGLLDKSLEILNKSLIIVHEIYGESHEYYALTLRNLSSCYFSKKDYPKAIEYAEKAKETITVLYGNKDFRYASCFNELSKLYQVYDANLDKAEEYVGEALRINKTIYGENSMAYANSLLIFSKIHAKRKEFRRAINEVKEAMRIKNSIIGETNFDNLFLNHVLCYYYAAINDTCNVSKNESKFINSMRDLLLSSFSSLSSYERASLWNQYSDYFSMSSMVAYKYPTKEMCETAYNSALLSKGLLLTTDIEFEKLIKESEDTSILELFSLLKRNIDILNNQYRIPLNNRTLDTDSLENVIYGQDIELMRKSKTYGDFTKKMRITCMDVKNALSSNDIAIEFINFPVADSLVYAALVMKRTYDMPKFIPILDDKQLSQLKKQQENKALAKIIWGTLEKELLDVKNIYFAPDGELYNIVIEALPHWHKECLMSDIYNMYRLSSTRELAFLKEKTLMDNASVYGGIKYDTKADLLVADSRRYRSTERSFGEGLFSIGDSLNLRAGAAYLPATKIEAEEINKTLEQKKIMTNLLIDTLATEGALKNLSGKKQNLLHIATHGFYWTEKEAKYRRDLDFLMINDNIPKYSEDKALTRSGLLLAGANYVLTGKKLPEGVDDGILTAKEIAQLDLRGLDLVVLSACQTGLGEIKGDGVFGLQRGFKKAGANSLLMSLWKVDDEATRLLMTQFYKNLTSGMSKYESLKQAQKYVREYEVEVEVKSDARPSVSARAKEQAQQNASREKTYKKAKKYQDPYYWAAFILLDALD